DHVGEVEVVAADAQRHHGGGWAQRVQLGWIRAENDRLRREHVRRSGPGTADVGERGCADRGGDERRVVVAGPQAVGWRSVLVRNERSGRERAAQRDVDRAAGARRGGQERGEQEAASHGRAHHSEPAATDQDAPADDQDPLAVAAWEAMAATAREGPRSAQQAEDLRDTPWDASGGSRAAGAGLSANGLSMRCYGGRHGRAPSSRLLTGNRMINRKLLIVNTLLRSVTEAPRVAAAPRSTSWHIPGHSPSNLAGTARWSAAAQPARPAAPQQHRADLGGDLTGPRHDVSPAVP